MAVDHRLSQIIAALEPLATRPLPSLKALALRLRWAGVWQGNGALSQRVLQRSVGGRSLRDSLRRVGAQRPVESLRAAFDRLAFPTGKGVTRLPNGPISLRRMAARVVAPDVVQLRFLSYNTYLLPGLQVPLGRWIDDAVGWDALSWFGIPFGGGLLVMLGVASIPGVALGTLLDAAGLTPSKVVRTLTGIDLNDIRIQAKPALDARAEELGGVLADYDVCCLCEVFTDDARRSLVAGLGQAAFSAASGSDGSDAWTFGGSGLFFLLKGHRIVRTERLVFASRGERLRDSDAWAAKGAMLNVLDLGFGELEVFQTHLYYGGGLPGVADPDDATRMAVWRAELAELASFVRAHHRPSNVIVVTGDFNMAAGDIQQHAELRRTMDGLDLHDLWAWDVYRHDPAEGHTCRLTDGEPATWWRTFKGVCAAPGGDGALNRCDDEAPLEPAPPRGVGRYDYVFVERPKSEHAYRLEASRVLRRPFQRAAVTDSEVYLSDHLALDLTLYLSLRSADAED